MRIKTLVKEIEALAPRAGRLLTSFPWRITIYRRRSRIAAALPISLAIAGAFVVGALVGMLGPRAQRERVMHTTRDVLRKLKPMAIETKETARELGEKVMDRVDNLRGASREQPNATSR